MKRIFYTAILLCLTALCGVGCQENKESSPTHPAEEALRLEILASGLTSVEFRVTPQSEQMTYVAMISPKSIFDEFESDEAFIRDDIAWFEFSAQQEEMSLEEYLEEHLHRGILRDTAEDLDPGTTYYLYAYGLSPWCQVQTDLYKVAFTTQNVEQIDLALEIQVENIDYTTADVTVTPDSKRATYFVNVMSEAEYADWGGNEEGLVAHLNALRNYYLGQGATAEQIIANLAFVGEQTYHAEKLSAGTKYIAYALGVNEGFFANSPAQEVRFTTSLAAQSDMTFQVEINEVDYGRVQAMITPSNEQEQYICSVQMAESLDWYESESEFMEFLLMDLKYWFGGVEDSLHQGPYALDFTGLVPQTDYVIVCFGYDGAPTTSLFTTPFTTTEATGNPADLIIDLKAEELTHNSVRILATPSVGAWYFISYAEATTFQTLTSTLGSTNAAILQLANKDIDYGADYFGMSRANYLLELSGSLGVTSIVFNQLTPQTDYVAYAVAVDTETGLLAAERGFSIPFTTLERIYSEARVTFHFGNYYDGTQLAELYPEQFHQCKGSAVLPYTIEVNEATCTWYTGFFQGDYTEWGCTDDDIYDELITYGYKWDSELVSLNRESGVAILPYDRAYSFLGIAQDAAEAYGYGTLQVVTLTREGVSPAEEFYNK